MVTFRESIERHNCFKDRDFPLHIFDFLSLNNLSACNSNNKDTSYSKASVKFV